MWKAERLFTPQSANGDSQIISEWKTVVNRPKCPIKVIYLFFFIFSSFFFGETRRPLLELLLDGGAQKKIRKKMKTKQKQNPNQPKKKRRMQKETSDRRERERESAWVGADRRLGWPSSVASTSFERRRRPAAFSTALIAFRWRQRHREREREKRPSLTRFGGCKRAD